MMTGLCSHCGDRVTLRPNGTAATHDFPKPCRSVCPGTGQPPKPHSFEADPTPDFTTKDGVLVKRGDLAYPPFVRRPGYVTTDGDVVVVGHGRVKLSECYSTRALAHPEDKS